MIPNISTIPVQHLSSGDQLSIQVYKFLGAERGKKVYLQANLHGAEIVGNAVIHQLIQFLTSLEDTQLKGEIWLVPVCNPFSTNQRTHFFSTGRYNVYDGKDWNRIFWDYEKDCENLTEFAKSQIHLAPETIQTQYLNNIKTSFAKLLEEIQSPSGVPLRERFRYQLQSLCIDANYVIDIHSSSNQAIDYLYGFRDREESAKYFLLDYGIIVDEDELDGNAFDEAFLKPWLALEDQLRQLGKPIKFDRESWTLELGSGMQMNPESVAKGVQGIKNYLFQKGILFIPDLTVNKIPSVEMRFVSKSDLTKYYAPTGGMIQSRVQLGTSVKAGEWLYQLLSFNKETVPSLVDVYSEQEGIVFDVSTNYAVNEGEYVLSIF